MLASVYLNRKDNYIVFLTFFWLCHKKEVIWHLILLGDKIG